MTRDSLDEARLYWQRRVSGTRDKLLNHTPDALWLYFKMTRSHLQPGNISEFRTLPLLVLPLVFQSKRMVELGSAFTYYPETYGNPPDAWVASDSGTEGLVGTRFLLMACKFLHEFAGIDATLVSVDLREGGLAPNSDRLLDELGLLEDWQPFIGTDTLTWLQEEGQRIERGEAERLDFVLVDSNHTYAQVSAELTATLPLLSEGGVMLVDDCYVTEARHGATWIPEDGDEGVRRGGEYGAVLEFLAQHPDWQADWFESMVLLSRRGNGPG